jgi:hypothetical protein
VHRDYVGGHENNKRENFRFVNVTGGEQHDLDSKSNYNVGGRPSISDSRQQMKGIGYHDGAFRIVDTRGLKRSLRAPSLRIQSEGH